MGYSSLGWGGDVFNCVPPTTCWVLGIHVPYSTFFSLSRLCWSFDLTWRSWNFNSFPINGKVSFSPLSIMVLAASNTYNETRLLARVTLWNLWYSLSVIRGQHDTLCFLIFVLMQGQVTAGQIHAREICPGPPRLNHFIINFTSGKGVNSVQWCQTPKTVLHRHRQGLIWDEWQVTLMLRESVVVWQSW